VWLSHYVLSEDLNFPSIFVLEYGFHFFVDPSFHPRTAEKAILPLSHLLKYSGWLASTQMTARIDFGALMSS